MPGREPVIIQDEGAPPGWGILGIIQELENQPVNVVSGCDYYIFDDGRWFGVDFAGMLDYLVNVKNVLMVGRMVKREKYLAAMRDARLSWEDGNL